MRSFVLLALVPMALAAAACPRGEPSGQSSPTTSGSAARAPGTPSGSQPSKYACAADTDCRMACSHGAVSRAWYDSVDFTAECKGGCTEGRKARCVNGECAAFTVDGKPDPGCTKPK